MIDVARRFALATVRNVESYRIAQRAKTGRTKHARSCVRLTNAWLVLAAALAPPFVAGQTTPPPSSPQNSLGTVQEMLCGQQGPPTSTEVPSIGCFRVSSGGTALGTFDGHRFAVTVTTGGEPKCSLDGASIECDGCVDPQVPECPVRLMVFTHNPDRSVSISVQRKGDGNSYLYRISDWERYLELRKTREEAEAAQTAGAPPGFPPAANVVPLPAQAATRSLPQGMVLPGQAEPTDGPNALAAIGWKAQGAYAAGQFAEFDALLETLSQPDQLTDDGQPRLQALYESIWTYFYQSKNWQFDVTKIAEWRKEYPDSYGADLVEAIFWRAWAWDSRGEGYAASVTSEGWKLFESRISRANEVLVKSKHRASRSPLWYQIQLGIARDAGWDHKRYRAVFDEATQRFPWYVPLYLWAANYLSPKWGGTYEEIDALARRTAKLPLGADYSLYTRVYWHVADDQELEFEPFHDSLASWPLMKTGFEGLMKRYPKSKWNLNAFAYFACRANDGSTYGTLRAKIGQDVMPNAWASNYSTEVCDERLLGRT